MMIKNLFGGYQEMSNHQVHKKAMSSDMYVLYSDTN